jgi:hypothetical protein
MLWVERLHKAGWYHRVGLEEGIDTTYRDFLDKTGAGSMGKE